MIKYINFLSTPSNHHHKNINRWYLISCGSIVALLASLSLVSAQQAQRWYALNKEQQKQMIINGKAQDFVTRRAQLTQEKASLLENTEEWEKYTHRAKKPSDMLSAIKKNSEQNKVISLRMVRRSVRFQMSVHTAQDGMRISQQLSSTTIFDEVKLTSFKSVGDEVEATIEGSMKA